MNNKKLLVHNINLTMSYNNYLREPRYEFTWEGGKNVINR